ncbi:T9SS type A sorting domain-containing protein [Ulvibacter antarcticus]|uniref:Putative secreted protein (Por secretion system target) n=1 Tax=Ulvibacter antarcticus TaxID=442714 RepID=A0A3L9YGH0_9FLAO|nr:T9SS type A sorting domain-containing protein [Ulvibacter antarcticus]RMA58637.1 putative secreted protein (Por secretion system target) [Ulvibacter antarcticus]
MKTKLLFQISLLLVSITMLSQSFQESISVSNKNYHDLNMEPTEDGSNDFIVAGNQFDAGMINEEIVLKRVKDDGSITWVQRYSNTPLDKARLFDIVVELNEIYLTGSVDVGGMKTTFIAVVNATTGAMLGFNQYTVISPNFNSRGLKIIKTNSDVNGDSVPDPGFVVGGFISDCYNLDTTCNFNNIGYVMRVDSALNLIWTIEIDGFNSVNNLDYDFVNGITETNDGFFITGSASGTVTNFAQQAVLAHKVDFAGAVQWDSSYIFGNSRDMSVDAYYDAATDEIYMLSNYSVSHFFGITVLDNLTGTIDFSKSWYATGNNYDKYAFKLMESYSGSNSLIITGYDRDENWVDVNSNPQFANSSVFVYEFDKNTGNQVGNSYQFLVPHVEPVTDEFNFWNGQLPIIYFPDISFSMIDTAGNVNYQHVGYRTDSGFTSVELFKTDINKRNECENMDLFITPAPISINPVSVISGPTPNTKIPASIGSNGFNYTVQPCSSFLGVEDNEIEQGSVYPNPAGDFVNISLQNLKSYILIDALGRTVMNGELTNEARIYVGDLNSGLYFIKVSGHDNKSQTYKFMKE